MNKWLEKLFDILDKRLHKITYLDLEDKVFSLEVDIESYEGIIEMYRDDAQERSNRR